MAYNNVINPNSAVIVYNYVDRLGEPVETQDDLLVEEINITTSLLSVKTSKTKSSPSGSFELHLAPSINWVSAITPGSWCVILMSRTTLSNSASEESMQQPESSEPASYDKENPNSKIKKVPAKENELRMVGRIDSVRFTAMTNEEGAISSAYVVTGFDWGSIFDSYFYVDATFAPGFAKSGGGGVILNKLFEKYMSYGKTENKKSKKSGSSENSNTTQDKNEVGAINEWTSTSTIKTLLTFWGNPKKFESQEQENSGTDKLLGKSVNEFSLPQELAKYLGYVENGTPVTELSKILRFKGGVLIDKDVYSDDNEKQDFSRSDGVSVLNPMALFEMNTMWNMLQSNCNQILNEMLCDIRFEGGRPEFTLYKRIKPFSVKPAQIGSARAEEGSEAQRRNNAIEYATQLTSRFTNIRTIPLPIEDIISINAGTNWKDRVNFIEVDIGRREPIFDLFKVFNKSNFQAFDEKSTKRDGLIPMKVQVINMPFDVARKTTDPYNVVAYLYLLKDWFFDTHRMLNGTVSVIGQDRYIQVGDNVLIPAKAINASFNYSKSLYNNYTKNDYYLLAHVESISNLFSVDNNGTRSYMTDIQFVRGIFVKAEVSETGEVTINDSEINVEDTLDKLTNKMTLTEKNNLTTTSKYDSSDKPTFPNYINKEGE